MNPIIDGIVNDPRVTVELVPLLEHGPMPRVSAVVLHQTNSWDARTIIKDWGSNPKRTGTHFIIDRGGGRYTGTDGKITQCARTTQRCAHVGMINSRCLLEHTCTVPRGAKRSVEAGLRGIRALYAHERSKAYPSRYPMNSDSIGIEIVTKYDEVNRSYPPPSDRQWQSVRELLEILRTAYPVTDADVYSHTRISYKSPGEGEGYQQQLEIWQSMPHRGPITPRP
jgi:N-acetyl-anhydromuramyl-L-alanine amidase AmpD